MVTWGFQEHYHPIHSFMLGRCSFVHGRLLLFFEESLQCFPILKQLSANAKPLGAYMFEHLLLLNNIEVLKVSKSMLPCGTFLEVIEAMCIRCAKTPFLDLVIILTLSQPKARQFSHGTPLLGPGHHIGIVTTQGKAVLPWHTHPCLQIHCPAFSFIYSVDIAWLLSHLDQGICLCLGFLTQIIFYFQLLLTLPSLYSPCISLHSRCSW